MKMKSLKLLLLAATAFLAAQTMSAQTADGTAEDPDTKYAVELLKPKATAPDFALPSLDGKTVKLSDFRGKIVVIDFWASWCSDCRKDAPAVVEMHREYKDKGVVFLGVSFDTNRESWANAVKKYGIDYVQVSNLQKWKETEVSKAYHVNWIPSMYVIDAEGKVLLGTVVSSKVKALLGQLTYATR